MSVVTYEGVEADSRVKALFSGWDETLIWSCLQGIMGALYVSSDYCSAMAFLGDFCFFAGKPDMELARLPVAGGAPKYIIAAPQSEDWATLLEGVWGSHAQRTERYAIAKEPGIFDRKRLEAAVEALPPEYELRLIDGSLYEQCKTQDWSIDLVSQYHSYEYYERLGLGVVALKGEELVSGASSYSSYRGGIEIEIDTRKDYRRRGLAYACGAALILACLDRGLYPSWDAQNLASVALAQKLGYHFSHAYPVYEINL